MPLNYSKEDAVMCWLAGNYDAELIKVEDKTSKVKPDGSGGNPMQVLTWRVFNDNDQEQLISDYIVIPTGTFKLKQLAVAIGKKDEFEAETFQADDQIGCTVKAELVIEKQDGYDDKNKIKKVKAATESEVPPGREKFTGKRETVPPIISEESQFKDDDIPF